jgi:hypothetical protein
MRISAVGILTALVIGCAASVALASTAAVAQTPSPLEIQAPTVAPPGQMPEMTPREALEMLRLCSADQGGAVRRHSAWRRPGHFPPCGECWRTIAALLRSIECARRHSG